MIVSKCPLRVSLAGGSTDLQGFLDRYKEGSVIGFPSTLYAHVILNPKKGNHHRIVYSKIEDVDYREFGTIQNDIVRECIRFFEQDNGIGVPPCQIIFEADIPSTGSGLASSSAYTIALLNALYFLHDVKINHSILCKEALEVERKFNPLVGYQDIYQSCLPSFKRLTFSDRGLESSLPLPPYLLNKSTMYLIPTEKSRSSTEILKSVNFDECVSLLQSVDELELAVKNDSVDEFARIINKGWDQKKKTSPQMVNDDVQRVEDWISEFLPVRAKRLCGAGGGGYFLVLCDSPVWEFSERGYEIGIDEEGATVKWI
jgi:D-glycero-alpha-D-manno-heptose-7-phosphate kinase